LWIINIRAEEHSIPNIDVSANNLKSTVSQTRYHISSVKHLYQVLFGVEFRISVVGICVLVLDSEYGNIDEERWLTYMTLLNGLYYSGLYERLG